MNTELLASIFGIISIIVTGFFTWLKTKQSISKYIKESLAVLQEESTAHQIKMENHIKKDKFLETFPEMVIINSEILIDANDSYEDSIKDALKMWFKFISDFGYYFYISNLRGGDELEKLLLKKHLESSMLTGNRRFENFLAANVLTKKVRKIGSREIVITFLQYYKGTKEILPNVHHRNNVLLQRMILNGLKEKEMTDIYSVYIQQYLDLFKDLNTDWNSLKPYKPEEENQ